MVIDSKRLREEYDIVIVEVCKALWEQAKDEAATLKNENGEAVRFNTEDLCNVMTNVVQRYRAEFVKSQG